MSFPQYPSYKHSGVEWLGEVPQYWAVYSLKRSVEGCVNGVWGDEPDGEFDIPVIRVADFDRVKSLVGLEKLTYRSIPLKERLSRLLKPGDLLIEKSGGGEKTLVGCTVLFEHDFEAVTSNFVARMRPHKDFESGFLCYVFDSLYQGRVNYPAIKQTTGIQNLDSEAYLQEYFCFPPLGEQTQIAQFLDHETAKIDALIEEQRRLIELLKEKRQAVISHAVIRGLDPNVPMKDSGVEWLGEVPAHWVVTRAKSVSSIFVPQRNKPDLNDLEGFDWVTMEDMKGPYISSTRWKVSEQALKEAGSKVLRKGAVIASCVGRFGIVAINASDVVINQQLQAFIPSSIKAEYLHHMVSLSKQYFELIGTAATLVYVNQQGFENLPVLQPPPDEQEKICVYVDQVSAEYDDLLSRSLELIKLLGERRSALISAAVTGKIDVRDWQPPASTASHSHDNLSMEVV